jgi:hypothetical protein
MHITHKSNQLYKANINLKGEIDFNAIIFGDSQTTFIKGHPSQKINKEILELNYTLKLENIYRTSH